MCEVANLNHLLGIMSKTCPSTLNMPCFNMFAVNVTDVLTVSNSVVWTEIILYVAFQFQTLPLHIYINSFPDDYI